MDNLKKFQTTSFDYNSVGSMEYLYNKLENLNFDSPELNIEREILKNKIAKLLSHTIKFSNKNYIYKNYIDLETKGGKEELTGEFKKYFNIDSGSEKNDYQGFIEKYYVRAFNRVKGISVIRKFLEKLEKEFQLIKILFPIPFDLVHDEVMSLEEENIYDYYDYSENSGEIKINSGAKTGLERDNINGNSVLQNEVQYDKWCNVIKSNMSKSCPSKDEILFTSHFTIRFDKNMKISFVSLLIKSKLLNYIFNYENFKDKIEFYLKLDNKNLNEKFLELKFYKTENESKIISKDEVNHNGENKIYLNGKIHKKISCQNEKEKEKVTRIEKEFTKSEPHFNYNEISSEWYEYKDFSDFSYGNKSYSNSKQRTFNEDWWKTENSEFKEVKVNRYLDDGLGQKKSENFGEKIRLKDNFKEYEYFDSCINNVSTNEEIKIKQGFDPQHRWNSFNMKTPDINHVENTGENYITGEEWFEKWYECPDQKFCLKKGKNLEREWEEEWKEDYYSQDYIEKKCMKKCKLFTDNYQWLETWHEKYCYNENLVYKYCYKMNEDLASGIKNEESWEDKNFINEEILN